MASLSTGVVPVVAIDQVRVYSDATTGGRVHATVSSHAPRLKSVPVVNFSMAIDGHCAIVQTLNLLLSKRLSKSERLYFDNTRTHYRPELGFSWWHGGEFARERKVLHANVAPMHQFVGWRLPSILDGYLCCGASLRVKDSSDCFDLLSGTGNWIRNIADNSTLHNYICPQLPSGRIFCQPDLLPNDKQSGQRYDRVRCRDVYDDPFRFLEPQSKVVCGVNILVAGYGLTLALAGFFAFRGFRWWQLPLMAGAFFLVSMGLGLLFLGHA